VETVGLCNLAFSYGMFENRGNRRVIEVSIIQYYDKLDLFVIIKSYFMKTQFRYFATYMIFSPKCLYTYANISHEFYVNLKKESTVKWCCHFKLVTNIVPSFSDIYKMQFQYVCRNKLRWVVKKQCSEQLSMMLSIR